MFLQMCYLIIVVLIFIKRKYCISRGVGVLSFKHNVCKPKTNKKYNYGRMTNIHKHTNTPTNGGEGPRCELFRTKLFRMAHLAQQEQPIPLDH